MIPIKEHDTAVEAQNEANEAEEVKDTSAENKTEKETESKGTAEEAGKEEAEEKDSKETSEKPAEDTAVEASLKEEKEKYLRLYAEYDNFRKRSQKEKENLYGDIRANVITSFLPVYDNLVRALAAETEDEAYRKGVEMIMNQFNSTLEKLGVTEIKAVGEKFDPSLHNAVMHVDDEEKGENEVVEEFQKGFKIGDKVIRFSMVKVAN